MKEDIKLTHDNGGVMTHYVPAIEEFHVGFEFEFLEKGNYKPMEFICNGQFGFDDVEDLVKVSRVKYLDIKDIESQDFVIQQSTWDRKSLKRTVIKYVPHPKFDSGAQFEKVINETLVWQIFWNAETGDMIIVKAHNDKNRRLVWSESVDKKEKTPPQHFMEFDERFKGIIKNKSEYKRILKQVGIVK